MSNLPPGVTPSMLPGNRPEDEAFDYAQDWLLGELDKFDVQPDEYKLISAVGLAAVQESRKLAERMCNACLNELPAEKDE